MTSGNPSLRSCDAEAISTGAPHPPPHAGAATTSTLMSSLCLNKAPHRAPPLGQPTPPHTQGQMNKPSAAGLANRSLSKRRVISD